MIGVVVVPLLPTWNRISLVSMIKRALLFLAVIAGGFVPAISLSAQTVFESKPTRTHLIELFTSEGCSSCPPAEAWLSKLKDDSRLWQDFVPVSFHVDYWDYLGWRDPFASKLWTARQYRYAAGWKSKGVYTPGFVVDGREWRDRELPRASTEASGILKVSMAPPDRVKVVFDPVKAGGRSFEIHVTRLGFGLTTSVKAGENSGRKLWHDFVVLSLADAPISSDAAEVRLPAAPTPQASNGRLAIAAWITQIGQTEPIQAVGGWLP